MRPTVRHAALRRRAALAAALAGLFSLATAAPPAAAQEWRQWEAARARLHTERIALLERQYHPYLYNIDEVLAQERANLKDALRNLCGESRPAPLLGARIDAYVSQVDDSAQPFVRFLPPQWQPETRAPLIVYLHGFAPFDIYSLPFFPAHLTNIANRAGACIAVPFARGNTDFQGIGETDVFRVMDEMRLRYNTDHRRVVLVGHSMGGLGAWCIASRHPQYFNAVMVLAGRGDFYVWHKLRPDDLPPWQRRLVDTQFASLWVHQMKNLPLLAAHGENDTVLSFEQGRAIFDQLAPHNSQAQFLAMPDGDHWAPLAVLTNAAGCAWFARQLTATNSHDFVSRIAIGETGSRLQNALQEPFVFIGGAAPEGDLDDARRRLDDHAREWSKFAQAAPRTMLEPLLTEAYATNLNLFVFGEPETSPLIRRIFAANGVSCTAETWRIGERTFPRRNTGLWFTADNPFNTNRTAVVQCGLRWGAMLPDNHRYDRIPDIIVYGAKSDIHSLNTAIGAGFINAAGQVEWSDPATTPAIEPPPGRVVPPF